MPAGDAAPGLPLAAPSATVTTTSTTSTTTTTLPPREVTITSDVPTATITLTDERGVSVTGEGSVTASVSGEAEVVIAADGYVMETKQIAATTTTLNALMDKEGQLLDKVAEFSSGAAPKQVAFRPGHDELWVTLLAGSGFEVYHPLTGELLAAGDLPEAGSVEVIFNRDASLAYVSQMETATVYEIDADTKKVLRALPTNGAWTKVMLLSPDERTLWASNWVSNDVSEIDLTTGEVRRKLATVTTPRGLYVTPDAAKLYVGGFENGDIQVFDLATGDSTVIYRTGGAMRHLVGDPTGSFVYASDMAGANVVVIDTSTDEVRELADVDRVPNTIDLDPTGRVLYVSNRGRNNPETYYKPGPEWGTVVVVDAATGAHLDAIVGGNQTTGLDVSPDGRYLAFSDFLDDRITVYAIPSYEVLASGGGGRWEQHLTELVK